MWYHEEANQRIGFIKLSNNNSFADEPPDISPAYIDPSIITVIRNGIISFAGGNFVRVEESADEILEKIVEFYSNEKKENKRRIQ